MKEKGKRDLSSTMEALIFSDSHGAYQRMQSAIRSHPDASHVLFLGDGLREIESLEKEFPNRIFLSVRGNCDGWFSNLDTPTERLVTLGGISFLMMHGHTHGVKGGCGVAASYAASQNATVLLFGHTHLPYEGYLDTREGRVHLFNPGSIGAASYGVLVLKNNGYLLSHGTLSK